jgi:hypothetical protein
MKSNLKRPICNKKTKENKVQNDHNKDDFTLLVLLSIENKKKSATAMKRMYIILINIF